jgi:hypothetical protein
MKPLVYTYYNNNQRMAFRGFIKTYQGATCTHVTCPEVRTNKAEALRDAKALLISIRKRSAILVA